MASTLPSTDSISFGQGAKFSGVRAQFRQNEEIFGECEPADHVYRVVSGAVRTVRFSSDGKRQVLGFHLPGDIFGLEMGAVYSFSAEAVSDAEVLLMRRSVLDKAVAEDPVVARAVLQLTAADLATARDHAMMLGKKGAGERVAAFLLRLADRSRTGADVELPMSRTDIADYLGLTIESVSRAFTEMTRRHTIGLPSARHVVMRSRSALLELEAA
jgi:CRP/FNR family nitrogen fixation transcriptional regulator